jgi:hypothetical protein
MAKRNLTVQLDDDVIARAKIVAAKRGMSVSGLVAQQLEELAANDERYDDAMRLAVGAMRAAEPRSGRRWARDELYDRSVTRDRRT